MRRIKVKEPITGEQLSLLAQPEDYNGEQGWRIITPDKDSFVILEKEGAWQVVDDEIHPDIISAIGNALRPYARYNSLS
ncbi:hypothetical protein JHJ32_16380 [Parapedobacter sp. ISTM3]|uniref:Uncharacterized protein n=1 Tax=Parapedobacter luteus TaxID=623280 RepID=A0A1T5EU73_9SPHI|nr:MULTISPECIES: hypothetical protein [Parapedobacter]MBK1441577.1 hypothetical protein [Parapedobacter sp. ISTM3]SKB87503.1 hypothetical protein SAMN05660226_03556 [Parapedobacter luteus]